MNLRKCQEETNCFDNKQWDTLFRELVVKDSPIELALSLISYLEFYKTEGLDCIWVDILTEESDVSSACLAQLTVLFPQFQANCGHQTNARHRQHCDK